MTVALLTSLRALAADNDRRRVEALAAFMRGASHVPAPLSPTREQIATDDHSSYCEVAAS